MGWRTTDDLDQFASAAAGYLRSRAAENTLLLSAAQAEHAARAARAAVQARAAHGARDQPAGTAPGQPARADSAGGLLFGWWEPPAGGEPRGAFVHDPAAPLLVSGRVPEMAASLAVALARMGRQLIGVDAPTESADAFAAAWSQRAGTAVRMHRQCRVYRLALPVAGQRLPAGSGAWSSAGPGAWPPPGAPGPVGRLRVATRDDLPLLAGWLAAFAAETADRTSSPADDAAALIGYGGAVFWEMPGHGGAGQPSRFREAAYQPVALATLTRPVAGTMRVVIVYTPPERRRSGYGAAVTLSVSRAVLGAAGNGAAGHGAPGNGATGNGATASAATASGAAASAAEGVLGGAASRGRITEVVMITDKNRSDHWGGRLGFQLVGERTVLRFGPVTGPAPRPQATGPSPRMPTGPLPRLPRLRP